MVKSSGRREIQALEQTIRDAQQEYHDGVGTSTALSDDEYDTALEKLRELDPTNPVLSAIGSTPRESPDAAPRERLPYRMPSLDKVRMQDAGADARLRRWAKDNPGPYTITDKLDGVSAMLVQPAAGRRVRKLYTRGDGITGRDVSSLLRPLRLDAEHVEGPPALRSSAWAVRGELVITRDAFQRMGDRGATARNLVAGAVNAKRPDATVLKHVQFVAYAIVHPAGLTAARQLELLRTAFTGLSVVDQSLPPPVQLDVSDLQARLDARRVASGFEIDGLVVASDAPSSSQDSVRDDDRAQNPTDAFAFKSRNDSSNLADTVVTNVKWSVSKDGLFKPVVEFEPVELGGVRVSRATGFNARFVQRERLGPGARIRVTRSGDVIPHIVEVTRPAAQAQMPAQQSEPGRAWTWDGVDAAVSTTGSAGSDYNDERDARLLRHFAEHLGIAGISTGVAAKLVAAGIRTPGELVRRATEFGRQADGAALPGFGPRSTQALMSAVAARVTAAGGSERLGCGPCVALMQASNAFGAGVGSRRLRAMLTAFPDAFERTPSRAALLALPGVQSATAAALEEGLMHFRAWAREQALEHVVAQACTGCRDKIDGSSAVAPASGATVVFSGVRDAELERVLEARDGCSVASTVTAKTVALVVPDTLVADAKSQKAKRARELGVPIVPLSKARGIGIPACRPKK